MEEIKNYIISQENTYKMPMEELHEIIAIDAENLVDKSLKHSITLQPVRLIGEPKPFDEDGKNVWSTSSIRKYLNSDEFITRYAEDMDLCQYFEHKKLKGYADFFNSSSSFCCGVI